MVSPELSGPLLGPLGCQAGSGLRLLLNIRPFVQAETLPKPANIKRTKDRGNEPQRPKKEYPWFWPGGTFNGDRVNNRHYTNAEKQAARKRSSRRDTRSEQ